MLIRILPMIKDRSVYFHIHVLFSILMLINTKYVRIVMMFCFCEQKYINFFVFSPS